MILQFVKGKIVMNDDKIFIEENYDFIYEDYFEMVSGDSDDLIFAPMKEEKKESEK